MSVSNCMYPWHWMIVTDHGDVLPCGHGSKAVGNLRENSIEEIWNGKTMQEVRGAILSGCVHEVCRSTDCPHQQAHLAFTLDTEKVSVAPEIAEAFDEAYYLESHADVRAAVERRQLASGFEHFARHGRSEGRAYRLVSRTGVAPVETIPNAALALIEYSRGATVLRSKPVDLVLQVSTVCNLACVMCPHGIGDVERPHPMPVAILDAASAFVDAADRMIVSGLGEPFIAPAFWRLVERCAGRENVFIRANENI